MPTCTCNLPDQDSAATFVTFNQRLHALDIWSSNRYRTQECNVIHTMSVKSRPTKLSALKLALSMRVWINTPLSKLPIGLFTRPEKPNELFIHTEWDSQGIIACGLRPTKQIWRPAKCREIEEDFWSKSRSFVAHIALSTTFWVSFRLKDGSFIHNDLHNATRRVKHGDFFVNW